MNAFDCASVCPLQNIFNVTLSPKVYRDKVAPSELWASSILVTSLVNFYLVGLCTEIDFTPEIFKPV